MQPIQTLFDSIIPLPSTIDKALMITGITDRSSEVKQGYVFFAIKGYATDGHDYIHDAIRKGAAAIIGEKENLSLPVPYVNVDQSRLVLAKLASRFYDKQEKKPVMIGITGTNGKTTTSFMLKHLFESVGLSCALFGTVVNIINGEELTSTTNTTLGPIELHRQLALSNDDIVIMEVSSHALTQNRVAGITFDFALFTNLSQDHLDYHQTMDDYFSAKKALFALLHRDGKAIINGYNKWGETLATSLKSEQLPVHVLGDTGDFKLKTIHFDSPMKAILSEQNRECTLTVPLIGEHNMYNAAMAYMTARLYGLPQGKIVQAFASFKGAPGRFELFSHPAGATFVVDYAHTEDAFSYCLQAIKQMGANSITHIFGFRGNRDSGKREAMIATSEKWANHIVLTFDDLNNVSEEDMRRTLLSFTLKNGSIQTSRPLAIEKAWNSAKKDDWVLITGKGHERYKQAFQYNSVSDSDTIKHLQNGTLTRRAVKTS
ncbi:UDP-N-acetylmuramoyl-L-alanyl-D-glutamate--2,6-diaminopimelate ligase [Alkalihalobacillus sp. LMS6]|uniref:UDP-N-acetylmuramoyl-L-alanyl-D-glutamate--2, 6-diaminopimelate ligase n=1 Tax=Alkalihalobacillus sp. LMS6 TaxID=2924034 RepID=UPI0020D1D453|nr:UDP-N-acetylmuramoyl-L-alanyl-D-glutamate--2,6-diaminopimelate ligase [Alkalihalobacillus sp. LMS6]UTR06686.1 UDP-N-acetylmuramoyl-L-alanyl-D-glutamate--2,6-diaminopimelate ligase [Alkalihalobacillus sp. LMS6]